jgi:asparagine synthase (glutamine-hydrolysing)
MCGIAGILDFRSGAGWAHKATVAKMADAIRHRGPDDSGEWADPDSGVALASRRLAVIDLSPAGHQPMVSSCGRHVIAYNGEIYNQQELRGELERADRPLRGRSDTELILESCAAFGLERTLARLNGMFAFALWDRHERELTLVRDRLGIKPLYVGRFGDLLIFGSELKSLAIHPGWPRKIDRQAVVGYARRGYMTGSATIYEGVERLGAGCAMTLRQGGPVKVVRYWSARDAALGGQSNSLMASDDEATEELERLLLDSVGRCMLADVPLGAFLSGGVDSSMVTALMQAQSHQPVRTFTIGFHEKAYNEANEARQVAAHLGTDHTDVYADSLMASDVIRRLPEIYDEPFGDASQIPTLLLCELTRRHVTVALTGDGGDELFGGYDRYALASRRWRMLRAIPQPIREVAALALRATMHLPVAGSVSRERWRRFAAVLPARSDVEVYRHFAGHWYAPNSRGDENRRLIQEDIAVVAQIDNALTRMQLIDVMGYLPDDILVKVDRASMAVSLEARVPLLDHRVAEFAFRLPMNMRHRARTTKWLLRRVLSRYVPDRLIDRPKMGLGVPVDEWIRGPLRPWAEDLLSLKSLEYFGMFQPEAVRQLWKEHVEGRSDWQFELWPILMMHGWCQRWVP